MDAPLYVGRIRPALLRELVAVGRGDAGRVALSSDGLGGQVSGRQTLLPDLAGFMHDEGADSHDNQEENQTGFIFVDHVEILSDQCLAKRLVRVLITTY